MRNIKNFLVALGRSVYQALAIMLVVASAILFAFWPLFFIVKYDSATLFIATGLWIIFVFLVLYRIGENLK